MCRCICFKDVRVFLLRCRSIFFQDIGVFVLNMLRSICFKDLWGHKCPMLGGLLELQSVDHLPTITSLSESDLGVRYCVVSSGIGWTLGHLPNSIEKCSPPWYCLGWDTLDHLPAITLVSRLPSVCRCPESPLQSAEVSQDHTLAVVTVL